MELLNKATLHFYTYTFFFETLNYTFDSFLESRNYDTHTYKFWKQNNRYTMFYTRSKVKLMNSDGSRPSFTTQAINFL